MTNEASNRTTLQGDVVAGSLALATLILADKVTALHFLFGLPLFIYLIRDFKRTSLFSERLVVSMAMSFVILLFACYPNELALDKWEELPDWDVILAILWFFIFPWVLAIRAEYELKKSRGKKHEKDS